METFKIMEWNINHRLGFGKKNMPQWVANVIKEKDADIIILTECSSRVPNWPLVKKLLFEDNQYFVFESNNNQANQNDVLVAVKRSKFSVIYSKSYLSRNSYTPDHMEVKCKTMQGQEFLVVGMRIHTTRLSDDEKCNEFKSVIDNLANEPCVIIGGDFNNYRRGFTSGKWCMNIIDKICNDANFARYTPAGSSIYQEFLDNDPFAFAEDHFIVKGVKSIALAPYDRSFVLCDKTTYVWGKDFQQYLGKNLEGKNEYESIDCPYPDHAILIAEVEL